MGVHFLATVAQVTRAIATSEPCAFDVSHASIADCSFMDERRKICCMKIKIRKKSHETKERKKTTFGIVIFESIWRRASWKMIA
jgi:hypothetical protein